MKTIILLIIMIGLCCVVFGQSKTITDSMDKITLSTYGKVELKLHMKLFVLRIRY